MEKKMKISSHAQAIVLGATLGSLIAFIPFIFLIWIIGGWLGGTSEGADIILALICGGAGGASGLYLTSK